MTDDVYARVLHRAHDPTRHLLGRLVATLVDEVKEPGIYTVAWDAGGVSSGVYFYRLKAGGFMETRKMVLTR